jgi:hypothetical protein
MNVGGNGAACPDIRLPEQRGQKSASFRQFVPFSCSGSQISGTVNMGFQEKGLRLINVHLNIPLPLGPPKATRYAGVIFTWRSYCFFA